MANSTQMFLIDSCPHCGVNYVSTNVLFSEEFSVNTSEGRWLIVRCKNPECKRLILVICDKKGVFIRLYPTTGIELDPSVSISQEIRDDFREAGMCLGAGCHKASLVMSRRALQRCLKEKGCTKRKLVDAIDEAIKKEILRKSFHEVATEVREYGNLGAHPDDDQLENVTPENAEQVLEFVRLLIHDFYEVPGAVASLKKQRETT